MKTYEDLEYFLSTWTNFYSFVPDVSESRWCPSRVDVKVMQRNARILNELHKLGVQEENPNVQMLGILDGLEARRTCADVSDTTTSSYSKSTFITIL